MSDVRSAGGCAAALVVAFLAVFAAPAGAAEDIPSPAPDVTLARPALLAPEPMPVVSPDAPPVGVVGGAAPFARKHASASFAVGAVGTSGFGAGFSGSFAWDLTERWGIELTGGVGGMQERGGGAVGGVYVDVGFLMPVTFNICSSVPRVCPALDFEISIFPGLAYGYLDGNHAGNVILGFGVSSLRKMQYLDVGVRASILGYIDVVGAAVEASADRLLGLVQLQLGCVVRWGVAQP
ncbi:MAG: hypothetical protein HY907_18535 [Deltaproteobacteria bacterium]|nr:hypothetical protein [Deltaproteobacteria bacterium]